MCPKPSNVHPWFKPPLAGRCNDFAPSRQKNCHRQKQPSRPGPQKKKKNTALSRPVEKKKKSHLVPPRKKNNRPVPPRKNKQTAPSRHEQRNTPPRGWKLETNITACLFFSLSCCTFISYCSLVRSIFLFLVFGWWSLSHTDTNTPPLSLCLAVMDAYLNPQPKSGAGQPPQAGAAEVPSPSQQQQPAPSGTSDVAGAGAGKHAKTSPVWLYYREVPVVTEGGKNVRCTVSRTIPATGKAPERTVESGLALTYWRQTDSRKGSGTSGMLVQDHLKRKHMKAWQDVQNRSSSSATTKKKLGKIHHADGEEGLESTVAWWWLLSFLLSWGLVLFSLLCDTMIPYHYTYGAATQTAVLLYTEPFFYFFTVRKIPYPHQKPLLPVAFFVCMKSYCCTRS